MAPAPRELSRNQVSKKTLGRRRWTLRRIEQATGSRRETVSAYLKAAGLAVHGPGRPATQAAKTAISGEVSL